MDNIQRLVDLLHTQVQSCSKCAQNSKEPNDGSFIQYDKKDSFSSDGTVRYGEEQDVDDL
ncbi:hypothetical protein FDC58_15840 [Clostridium botulinum]|uniref:hypothetical protein n=1 Tax=Clostridium TaxID=1485 RepID=UPI0005082C52|nr:MULTISPECIES: hypothetical protein [unclassified Clostridium]AIY79377.1 hypothetical protein U728_18 [Clostridium botulinum 202F]KAI3348659.1 hypothetical protein CIT17_02300 [Clostridium botulinum]KFX58381.1 hypothetical protein KU40_04845 [Clostridium botulinum]KFX59234.1 hypothetical protein KU41_08465 [Clostridium botulinum]KON12524.1 hypothetical protein ACP50_11450 [Clostridium botulinum]